MESKLEVTDDCGECINCKDKPKFGGPNKRKLRCQMKKHNKIRHRCSKKQTQILYQKKEEKQSQRQSASSRLIESNPVMTISTFLCQERKESLTIVDYPDARDPVARRYKAKRNGTDPLVIQISPLQHDPDHVSSSLCLGTPEADILPVLARSRVSVTEVVTMFLIEASGGDIVYRSRACVQLIPSLFISGKCDSCMGLIENIKHLEQFFADESLKKQEKEQKMVIKGEGPVAVMETSSQIYDNDDDNADNFIEPDDLTPLEKPLIIQFTKKDELDKMLMQKIEKNKSEAKRLRCEYCTTTFVSDKRRLLHMKNHHYDKYIEELLSLGKKVFTCSEHGCERSFLTEGPLHRHAIKVHNVPLSIKESWNKSKCPFCEQIFKKGSVVKLFKHVQVLHFMEADTQAYKEFMQANTPKLCPHCGSSFPNDRIFTKHLKGCKKKSHEMGECHICGKTMKKYSLKSHIERQHTLDDVCPCPFCGKLYPNRLKLNNHTMTCVANKGRNEENFECPKCGKAFNKMKDLSKHVRRKHDNEKNHACDQCGKRFCEINRLRAHIIAIHDKLKPFICDLCGFKTAKHSNLNIHRQKSHTKPFLSLTAMWQMIQRGEHPYIDNSYEFLHLIKPSRNAERIYNPQ